MGRRKITINTSSKVYKGDMDVANDSLRTIDIFNSSNIYWKNPVERSFEDAMQLYDTSVFLEGSTRLGEFPKIQIRLSEIVFFQDSGDIISDGTEKKRADSLKSKTGENLSKVKIITKTRGYSFFYVIGNFYGLFKSKSNHRFIPVTKAKIKEIVHIGDQWSKKEIPIESGFIGISTRHIEACTFTDISK